MVFEAGISINSQLDLFEKSHSDPKSFRPIHYLGSKLRLIDPILAAINEVDTSNGSVCDLFAGSGSVSYSLSKLRKVVSVDIQEYSRVICSAIISPRIPSQELCEDLLYNSKFSQYAELLYYCAQPLTDHEEKVAENALINLDPYGLCDLLENGSVISYELGQITGASPELSSNIQSCLQRISSRQISNIQVLTLKHFGGLYFSYRQATQIDILLHFIHSTPSTYKDFFIAALLSAVSECVNTVGKQFAQPIKPRNTRGEIKPSLGKTTQKDRGLDVIKVFAKWVKQYSSIPTPRWENSVLKMDFRNALDSLTEETTLVYADPPYTRDHYSRYYHVLETLAIRDFPKISTTVIHGKQSLSRGLYRLDRHQSPFCIKNQALPAFEALFSKARSIGAKIVLSYSPYDASANSHPRVVTIDQIEKIAKQYYSRIDVQSIGTFSHSKLTESSKHLKAAKEAEKLIICE